MAKDIEDVRADINQMYEKIQSANYYEILGVTREAEKKEIMSVYRNLARQWHVDRYSMFDLGPDKEKLQKIFAEINNAQRTLIDPDKREEYNEELEGGAVDGADVVNIFNADKLFLRGKNFLQQGSYRGAFEQFEEASELNPDDQDIYIHKIYTEYLLIPKNEEGKPHQITRANQIYEELAEILNARGEVEWLMVFLGTVGIGLGKERQAKSLFREVMMINPKNYDAQRQLRLIEMRKERDSKKGFFEKLMDKFKK